MLFAISTSESKRINNEDYGFLRCDSASLGKWFLIFWRDVVLWPSRVQVF